MLSTIYFERQEHGSMLCAQHSLNNLLQDGIYTPQDLAHNAQVLDDLESAQLNGRRGDSTNYDDSGFFSIGVMEEALKPLELRLVRWGSEEMKSFHANPENMEGFILNQNLHWYTVRRFGTKDHFYTLDSCREEPEHVSPMYLGLMLRDAEQQGYSIFAVLPTADSKVGGLPPCEATTEAARIPPPGSFRSYSSFNPTNAFSGHGNVLGGTSASSSGLKRYSEEDGSGGEVSDESNARSRRPRLEDQQDFMTEDEQMALAIADSLQLSSISTTASPAKTPPSTKILDDSDSDIEIISSATTTRAPLQLPRSRSIPPTVVSALQEPKRRSRADQEEEDELEAAIKASMMGAPAAVTTVRSNESKGKEKAVEVAEEEHEEEFEEPSPEELRRRRLARFG